LQHAAAASYPATIGNVIYEWDAEKAADNERRHGVSFDEAKTVFLDPLAESFDDPDHTSEERRFITNAYKERNPKGR
jgi:uncharacterized DUF497 family protein